MGGEQLPRDSKYQRVGSCLLLLRANPYFRALLFSVANRFSWSAPSDLILYLEFGKVHFLIVTTSHGVKIFEDDGRVGCK
jgi:hypothetical protein